MSAKGLSRTSRTTLGHNELIAEDAVVEGNTEEIKDEGRAEVDDEAKLKTKSEEGGA